MVYTPRAIDLNLFVDAASKGFNDGAKVPSPFASFVEGAITGLDESQKYESNQQTIEQNAIKLEQAPYQTEILKTQAESAKIQGDAMRENPDVYKDSIIQAQKVKNSEMQQKAILDKQKSDLDAIKQSGDGVAQGKAYMSGQFKDYFNTDPKAEKQYVDDTNANWDKADRTLYGQQEFKKREDVQNAAALDVALKDDPKNLQDYLSDPGIQSIKGQIGKPVSDADLLEKGTIATVQMRPKTNPILADGKPVLDEYNNPTYDRNGLPSLTEKPEEVKVLQFDGKQYEIQKGSDTEKIFNNYKTSHSLINQLGPAGDGIGALNAKADTVEKMKANADAEASLNYEKTQKQAQTYNQSFNSGANITVKPAYKKAAESYNAEMQRNADQRSAEQQAEDQKKAPPPVTPQGVGVAPQRPEGLKVDDTGTPVPTVVATGTATPPAISTPRADETPFASATATNTPSGSSPTATPGPQEQFNIQKQALAKSKSQMILQKRQPTDAATPALPSPVTQAQQTTASSFMPTKMQINSSHKPDTVAITKVAALEGTEKLAAITKALISHESRGNPKAVSPTGVPGLAQITGATGRGIFKDFDPTDNAQNMIGAGYEFDKLMRTPEFKNNPMLALTSYNVGIGPVMDAVVEARSTDWDKVSKVLPDIVQNEKWTAYWKRLENDVNSRRPANKQIKIDPAQKAIEARNYAEQVVANFPSFAYSRDDMVMANRLKQQKVLTF